MVKLSRYFLIIIAVISLAIAIPKLYWITFATPVHSPFVMWSCIDKDFMITRSGNGIKRTSRKLEKEGKTLTRNEYEQKLPLLFVRQLLMNKTMPDSIDGVYMDTHEITVSRSTFRVRPKDIHSPKPTLYPLFESQSGRASLTMPPDFFRITWRMEFIDAKTNKIEEQKSRMFSAVLYKRGFKFPATSINGIPTTRKSCDEGYLVTDAQNQLFHIKMVQAKPYVQKVDLPEDLKFKTIQCVDFKNKKYYAYLFSTDNHLYILTQYDYRLVKFPVENINPDIYEIRIYSDLFNFNIICTGNGYIKSDVLDASYNFVDKYTETWPVREQRTEGKIAQFLFPAEITTTAGNSKFIKFRIKPYSSFYWLIFSIVLISVQIFIVKRRNEKPKKHIADLIIIAITGIFGFIAVNFFPNKFFD